MANLDMHIPVKIAYITDGMPMTYDVEISEVSSVGATLLSREKLAAGLKIGLVVTSRDERILQVFFDAGLVSKPFSELRTQAKVLDSRSNDDGRERTRILFIGNLRIADAAGR